MTGSALLKTVGLAACVMSMHCGLAQAGNWTGYYLGVSPSLTVTNITNSADTDHGFTNTAFGVNLTKIARVYNDLLLGAEVDLNMSPFNRHKFKNSPTTGNFDLTNRNKFFGSLLASVGTALNQHVALFLNAGVGYLKTKTRGVLFRAGVRTVSHHNQPFVLPVVGTGFLYQTDSQYYGKVNVRYYVPRSRQYFSTVGRDSATLRKGVLQTGVEFGRRW